MSIAETEDGIPVICFMVVEGGVFPVPQQFTVA